MAATNRHPGARNTKPSSPGRAAVPTDAVFTIDELATYLKLPKRTLYKLAQEDAIMPSTGGSSSLGMSQSARSTNNAI